MHSWVGSKQNVFWIWIAICRVTKLILGVVIGDRSTKTGKKLYQEIKDIPTNQYCTDYWKPYSNFLPPPKHTQSKKETYTIEGFNSLFRHYLARLKRKTKCYSKSKYMLDISINLLIQEKLNIIG